MPVAAAKILAELQERAGRIDAGEYPVDLLHALGREGFFKKHIETPNDFFPAIESSAQISAICAATGFMTWCQSVLVWYLFCSENSTLRELVTLAAQGSKLGGTALSNPMKYYAGFEELRLKLTYQLDGFTVNGNLPWVSNLASGHWFGFIAGNEKERVMFLGVTDDPGVSLQRTPVFVAMEGTGTYALKFRSYQLTQERVLAADADIFVRKIKNGFVMLQLGIGLGLLRSLIEIMQRVITENPMAEKWLASKTSDFENDLAKATTYAQEVASYALAEDNYTFAKILSLRLFLAEKVLAAANHALLLSGARGFFLQSLLQRKIREAQFFAILSPSIRHLRKELERLSFPQGKEAVLIC